MPGTKKATGTTRHVALLRGVNVNGITIKSAELKALFVELGFGAVRTVLASGNVPVSYTHLTLPTIYSV